jgi:hypothetical protein
MFSLLFPFSPSPHGRSEIRSRENRSMTSLAKAVCVCVGRLKGILGAVLVVDAVDRVCAALCFMLMLVALQRVKKKKKFTSSLKAAAKMFLRAVWLHKIQAEIRSSCSPRLRR